MKTNAIFPAALNLMLPGLGHLYLGQTVHALSVFAGFCLLLSFPHLRWTLPLLATVAAWQAYRQAAGTRFQMGVRVTLYIITAALGAFIWLQSLVIFPSS